MESSVQNRYTLRLLGLYILLGGFFVPFWAMASKRFDKRHTLAIATSIQCLGADLKAALFGRKWFVPILSRKKHVHRHCSSEEEEEKETLFYHTLCFQLQVTPSLKTKWWVAPKALRAVALLVAFLAVSPPEPWGSTQGSLSWQARAPAEKWAENLNTFYVFVCCLWMICWF